MYHLSKVHFIPVAAQLCFRDVVHNEKCRILTDTVGEKAHLKVPQKLFEMERLYFLRLNGIPHSECYSKMNKKWSLNNT